MNPWHEFRSFATRVKVFHCDHCGQPVFFENTQCLTCGHLLAYLTDLNDMGSLDPDGSVWRSPSTAAQGRSYRLCRNYEQAQVCNWTIPVEDENYDLCRSCRLTRVIPDLTVPGNADRWHRLEVAKRRLVYTLFSLGLPVVSKADDPDTGLAFEFLADSLAASGTPVLTGHQNGVIRINVLEADDAERERRRLDLHEPYRTLLGHFRHEVGHYYWDLLVRGTGHLDGFRMLFGDERIDYGHALQQYYSQGPGADWPQRYVSAYASAHPWEDWAETWAHYLHMTDTLETAAACGLSLRPGREDEPCLRRVPQPVAAPGTFDQLIASWFPVTYVLNHLNRGMGLPDGYPFVLSPQAVEKLRCVHDTIALSVASALAS